MKLPEDKPPATTRFRVNLNHRWVTENGELVEFTCQIYWKFYRKKRENYRPPCKKDLINDRAIHQTTECSLRISLKWFWLWFSEIPSIETLSNLLEASFIAFPGFFHFNPWNLTFYMQHQVSVKTRQVLVPGKNRMVTVCHGHMLLKIHTLQGIFDVRYVECAVRQTVGFTTTW